MIVDRSAWGRLRVGGPDRVRFLQGVTTINVASLTDGAHAWGAILNPKGRVLAVIDIAHAGDALIVACEAASADAARALLERYAVMDDVTFAASDGAAHQVWTSPADVWTAPIVDGAPPDGEALPDSDPRVERVRIRAGFLRYGADVDADHFPFETPLGLFLDYGKGCYVGQEPVFRVHSQGNAARALRGFEIAGIEPIAGGAAGAAIHHAARDAAGTLTSAVDDPDRGVTLALGYLHRTVSDPGGTVTIDGRSASVHELPW